MVKSQSVQAVQRGLKVNLAIKLTPQSLLVESFLNLDDIMSSNFFCPITNKAMYEPVKASDGFSVRFSSFLCVSGRVKQKRVPAHAPELISSVYGA